ncbi:ArgP/LysG family DNA-binding transcriptional regulator [Labrys neptuniae]
MDLRDLATLIAIAENGSLEAAARALHVTASAVSQRLAKLEDSFGDLLIIREQPTRLTRSGEALLRTARQIDLLLHEARQQVGHMTGTGPIAIAVHHDSLTSWFVPAMTSFQAETGRMLEIVAVDHTRTRSLLRAGNVAAAISSEPDPLPGCIVDPIGTLKYWAVSTPERATSARDGRAPVIFFEKDDTPTLAALARKTNSPLSAARCYIPSVRDIQTAVLHGAGWAVLPEPLIARDLASGNLVVLEEEPALELKLFLHSWRSESRTIKSLRSAIKQAFRASMPAADGGL